MTTTERPADFDKAVIEWLPLLRRLASRIEDSAQERDDLVQDTIANALEFWETYSAENKLSGWLCWRMRGVATSRRRKRHVATTDIDMAAGQSVQPAQDHATDAARIVRSLAGSRSGDIVLRVAMGDSQADIAREQGCCRENIKQIYHARRKRLRKQFGYSEAA